MQQFEYKNVFITQKVGVSKEMISYKDKNIPSISIMNWGIEVIPVGRMAMGQAMGGIIGGIIASEMTKRQYGKLNEVNKEIDLKNLPAKIGQILISYQESPESKKKLLRIPLDTKDPQCQMMMESFKTSFAEKFLGVGLPGKIQKEMNLPSKGIWLAAIVIILAIAGVAASIILSS